MKNTSKKSTKRETPETKSEERYQVQTIWENPTFRAVLDAYDNISAWFETPDPTLPTAPDTDTPCMDTGSFWQEDINNAVFQRAADLLVAAIDCHMAQESGRLLRHYRQSQAGQTIAKE